MNSPATREQMKKIGADLVAPDRRSPEYLQRFFESEIVRWAKTIKARYRRSKAPLQRCGGAPGCDFQRQALEP